MKVDIIQLASQIPQSPKVAQGRGGWMDWGKGNDYPQGLAEMVNFSPTHQAIIKTKARLTAGTGFTGLPEVDEFNRTRGESLDNILTKIGADEVTFGGFALQIIWSKGMINGGFRITEIHHMDFSNVRLSSPDKETGKIGAVYISKDWAVNSPITQRVPLYNPDTAAIEPLQILYVQQYTPGQNVYPSPDYSSAINYINLDYEISKFHLNYVANGMTPGLAVMVPEIPNDEERAQLKRDLQNRYTGTDNAGRIMVFFGNDENSMPKIQDIASGASSDIYNTLNDITAQKIITAHRLVSPVLAGLPGAGGIGSTGQEIATAHEIFLKTVIEPSYQQPIILAFEMLFLQNGVNVELGIENKKPIQNIFSESLLADIATDDELREMAGLPPLSEIQKLPPLV